MGAVFQLCHFKSKKTQTAPNCLLPRELSTPQKPSSGQQWYKLQTLGLGSQRYVGPETDAARQEARATSGRFVSPVREK